MIQRRIRRRLAGPAVLIACLSLGLPGQSGNAAPGTPTLAGINLINARRSGALMVSVPSRATVTTSGTFESPNISIRGRGRIFGFILIEADASDPRTAAVVSALRFGGCHRPGCSPADSRLSNEMVTVWNIEPTEPNQRTYELPAGRYYLHFVTDGAPVQAQLTFSGFSGHTRVAPAARTSLAIRNFDSDIATIGGLRPLYSSGGAQPNSSQLTLMAKLLTFDIRPHEEHYSGSCYYADGNRPPLDLNVPTCPFGVAGAMGGYAYPALRLRGSSYGTALAAKAPGSWYHGVYFDGIQGEADISTSLLWLDLFDPSLPGQGDTDSDAVGGPPSPSNKTSLHSAACFVQFKTARPDC